MVTLDTVQKKKTMKKESGFKLKSGNKPSPAKMFGGVLGMLGKRRTPGVAASMVDGSFTGMGRRAPQVSRPGVIGALAGAARRNMPKRPRRGAQVGFVRGGSMPGSIVGQGRRRRRGLFGGLFRRR